MELDNLKSDKTVTFTINHYLNGTSMSKGTALGLNLIRQSLDMKYGVFIEKFKKLKLNSIHDKEKKTLYLEVQLPSESYDMFYQIVIEFKYLNENEYISFIPIRVFSNCPSFTYTYAYVYNLNGLLIPQLRNKYNKQVLVNSPIQRNNNNIMSYEKSLYYVFKYLNDNYSTINEITRLNAIVYKGNSFNSIKSDEEIQDIYNAKRKQELAKKKAGKETEKNEKKVSKRVSIAKKLKLEGKPKNQGKKSKVIGKNKITGKSKIQGKAKRK